MAAAVEFSNETLQYLIRQVARTFYQPRHIVALDQLARHPVIKDDDLAGRVGLQLKELGKVMATLVNDKLVKIYRQNELKEGQQRVVGRAYYYIDYQHFCNVVKWRVAEMRRIIDSKMRNELDNKGYICPQCNKSFSPLEADRLMDFDRGVFACDICNFELIDNENAESVKGSQDRMKRFNAQMSWIRDGLRKTEDMVMPAFDIADWVRKHIMAANGAADDGLKIAGSSGQSKEHSLQVEMSVDKDDDQKRAERDRKADATRRQNQLPSWHLKSTVSGQLTALGIANSSSDNAAILAMAGVANKEVKPIVGDKSDYYDRYYAALGASGGVDESHTPEDTLNVLDSLTPLETWNDDDDMSYPGASLFVNGSTKRSREDDDGDPRISKQPRLGNGNAPYPHFQGPLRHASESSGSVSSVGGSGVMRTVSFGASSYDEPPAPAEDPMVLVNGVSIQYSKVTEEHHDQMTPDEYEQYFNIMSALGH